MEKKGDFVKEPMSACTGNEIMTEVVGHLGTDRERASAMDASICIPCMTPFITSQFLRRSPGDQPNVLPERPRNLAFIGQFCEIPEDVVFTVEYSVRSAQKDVYGLLGHNQTPPAVYKGGQSLKVLVEAYRALHETAPV